MNIIKTNLKFGTMSNRKKTTSIILHHSACKNCSAEDIHKWHLNNGWAGAGYHFLVRKNGKVYALRPIDKVGAHASGSNSYSIGVCFEGDFENETMSNEQKQSGKVLVTYLRNIYPSITKLLRHSDVCATACPGKNFPFNEIIDDSSNVKVNYTTNNENCVKDDALKIDGIFGVKTCKKAQKVFGTPVDGIISNQLFCYKKICKGIVCAEWSNNKKGGSLLVKAIQSWLGEFPDGYIGPDFIVALQKKMGTPVDGILDNPSMCIKAFQKWLNTQ